MTNDTQDSLVLEFVEELPESTRVGSAHLVRLVEKLQENPGQWAIYPYKYYPSTAGNINAGRIPTLNGCEAKTRKGTTYIRWVGDTDGV